MSIDSGGAQANDESGVFFISISADGRFVAFQSLATNLVPGDTNQHWDIFVRDRQGGATERVSVDSGESQANFASFMMSISGDGRFVAFESVATNLVAGDTNGASDIFVRDRQSGTTERVSVATGGGQANTTSYVPAISRDGRFVAFMSHAANLVAGDTNSSPDIFVHDRQSGATDRVSVSTSGTQGNGQSRYPSISADGRFVAFQSSSSNLTGAGTSAVPGTFVHDRQSRITELVSVATAGTAGNLSSHYLCSISGDGRFVAFASFASNLVAGDTNGKEDVFVHDRHGGTTERVSLGTDGTEGDSISSLPSISADGRFVTFHSSASTLVTNDTNAFYDVFLRDRQLGTTERVSVATGGTEGNSDSSQGPISADGRFVAFTSIASNLVPGDTNGSHDVFVHDRGEPEVIASCFGDGSSGACPCGNNGAVGAGCENSASTGGAVLAATGSPSLSADTLVLTASGELPTALSVFLQSDAVITGVNFGDGLLCVHGNLTRLYLKNASGGVTSAPRLGEPSISTRSALLGDLISMGATRHYQTYYRDPVLGFCPVPAGNSWNVTNVLSAVWSP